MSGFANKDLTDKQLAFVREYLLDLNAAAAARRAGYSPRTARAIGQENLTKPDIRAAIAAETERRADRTRVTQDRVVKELARLGFTDMTDFVEWGPSGLTVKPSSDLSDDDSPAVTHVKFTPGEWGDTVEIKLGHKDSSLRMLGQHLGMFKERIEHTGKNGGPIEQRVSDADLEARQKLRERDDRIAELKRDLGSRRVAGASPGEGG